MPFYEKVAVRIRYEETGSGIPLLIIPGGGLNSTIAGLSASNSPFNPIDEFKAEYSCIAADLRNVLHQAVATDHHAQANRASGDERKHPARTHRGRKHAIGNKNASAISWSIHTGPFRIHTNRRLRSRRAA